MALNTCEMWSNGIKIAFFSKKLLKIAQRLGALPPDPKSSEAPKTPVCVAKSWLHANRQQRFQIFHSTISLSAKNFLFGKILMTSFRVNCGLGLSQPKILGTPISWRSPEKKFLKTFFLRTLAPVSLASSIAVLGLERFCTRKGCPLPWPWIFFCVLGLGLELCVLNSTSSEVTIF